MQQAGALPVPVRRLALLTLFVAGLFAALFAMPKAAHAAGVTGVQESWEITFGEEPGEVFDPKNLGVDPVDGSVYIVSDNSEFTEKRIEKFSPTGTPEGAVSVSREPDEPSAEGLKGFIGIAVDHSRKRFYLVQAERGLESDEEESAVATKILVFSTEPNDEEELELEETIALPAANGANTLLWPQELRVDPSNGDLVLSAANPAGHAVLQRISPAGVEGERYEETQSFLQAEFFGENFGFEIGADGTTYVVANTGATGLPAPLTRVYTLPPDFEAPPSGPLLLTALPGFEAAATSEGWGSDGHGMFAKGSIGGGDDWGPQVALVIAPDGEETLFWKAGANESDEAEPNFLHGYSLQQKASSALYGEPTLGGECSIEKRHAALAAAPGGSLLVLDQGERVFDSSTAPSFQPHVYRFGPGGEGCPGPAPLIRLKEGGTEVTGVSAGTHVTLDASGSELGGTALKELVWTIEGPGGTETIPVSGPSPALEQDHVFAAEGAYTVKLGLENTSQLGPYGLHFVAKPKHLTVTAASATEFPLTLTTSGGTGTGAVQCKVGGGSVAPCAAEYPEGTMLTLVATASSGSEFVEWTGECDTEAGSECAVEIDAAKAIGAVFDLISSPSEFQLNVTKSGTGSGSVTSSPSGIDCGVTCGAKFAAGSITLQATAVSGSTFAGWEGGGCTGTGSCTVVLNANTTVKATFTATDNGGGSGGGTGGGGGSQGDGSGSGSGSGGQGSGSGEKTKAQVLSERRAKARTKCRKLHGKARAMCMKRANQIGKPKRGKH